MLYLGFETVDHTFVYFHVKSVQEGVEDVPSFVKEHYTSLPLLQKLTMSSPVLELHSTLSTSLLEDGHEVYSASKRDFKLGNHSMTVGSTCLLLMQTGEWVEFQTQDSAFAWEPSEEVDVTFTEIDLSDRRTVTCYYNVTNGNLIHVYPQPQRESEDFFWVALSLDSSFAYKQRLFLLLPLSSEERDALEYKNVLDTRHFQFEKKHYDTVIVSDPHTPMTSLPVVKQHRTWKQLFPRHLLISVLHGSERAEFRPKDTSYDQWILYHLDPLIARMDSAIGLGITRGEAFNSSTEEEFQELREFYRTLQSFRKKRVARMETLLQQTKGKTCGTLE
jgi:hypothetical protein